MLKLLLALPFAVAACATPVDDDISRPEDVFSGAADDPNQGMEAQGKHLLGETIDPMGPDPLYHLSATTSATDANGNPATVVFAGGASLRGTTPPPVTTYLGNSTWFDNLILDAVGGGQLKLRVSRGDTDVTYYLLWWRPGTMGGWSPLCGGAEAVPMNGRWNRRGLHQKQDNRITFGCADGGAFKCIQWRYHAGSDDSSLLWRTHQACTRMMRADRCGDGTTHTREGTLIAFYDAIGITVPIPATFAGVASWPPSPSVLYFEAGWIEGDNPATCMSRLRWQGEQRGDKCGGRLPDPRLNTIAAFCEDAPVSSSGALLIANESRFLDLRLHVWKLGNDYVSTVRGFDEVVAGVPTTPPFPLIGTHAYQYADAMLLRAIPAVEPSPMVEVRAYRHSTTNDLVIARVGTLPSIFVDEGFEGYVYTQPHQNFVALQMFRHPGTGDLLTTFVPPPAGYMPHMMVGYTQLGPPP